MSARFDLKLTRYSLAPAGAPMRLDVGRCVISLTERAVPSMGWLARTLGSLPGERYRTAATLLYDFRLRISEVCTWMLSRNWRSTSETGRLRPTGALPARSRFAGPRKGEYILS